MKDLLTEMRFMLFGHVLNPLWADRDRRRYIRNEALMKRHTAMLRKYRPFVENMKIDLSTLNPDRDAERVFSIWLQGEEEAPVLIKTCFKRLREIYGDKFVALDSETIPDWIDIPDFIIEKYDKGELSAAHFTDVCRMELVYKYGGMWFDSTDYLTSPAYDWVKEADFFVYHAGDHINHYSFIQNCFISARRGAPLLKAWMDLVKEYWKNEPKSLNYFMVQILFHFLITYNKEARRLYEKMPHVNQDPTHVLWEYDRDKVYTPELYVKDTEGAFFQKTTYRNREAKDPVPGTVADYVVHGRTPLDR